MADTRANGNAAARAGQGKPTKMDAVRQALQVLGKDARAAQIQAFARDKLGVEISTNHVYNCLSEIRKAAKKGPAEPQAKKKAGQGAAPVRAAAAARTRPPAPPRAAAVAGSPGGLSLEDVATAKGLLERVGPVKLRALLDVLAR